MLAADAELQVRAACARPRSTRDLDQFADAVAIDA